MRTTIQYIEKELAELYPKPEIDGFVRLIMESVAGFSYTDLILRKDEKLSVSKQKEINEIVIRLKNHEPIQYILGETEFFGLQLKLTSSVLIPRPETEELVQWILDSPVKGNSKILDIGTGSGCIALALKKKLPEAEVCGVDISEEALVVAKKNGEINNIKVDFIQSDILTWKQNEWPQFDVIVSNPPYVRECEKRQMEKNVLEFEPDSALYVSDNNPLIFYKAIADFAQQTLCKNGRLYLEINEFLDKEMSEMLREKGFKNIQLREDINGRKRMMSCSV